MRREKGKISWVGGAPLDGSDRPMKRNPLGFVASRHEARTRPENRDGDDRRWRWSCIFG